MPGEKPAKASLDWKPNLLKCQTDLTKNFFGAKRGTIRYANLLSMLEHSAPLICLLTLCMSVVDKHITCKSVCCPSVVSTI